MTPAPGSSTSLPEREPQPNPAATPRDLSRVLFWPALVFWAVAKALFTFGRYFNQDEFESMHQGWLLHAGRLQYLDFNSNHPPFFFELLSRLFVLAEDPIALLYSARTLTLVSAAVQLALVVAIARAAFGARAGRWALVVYAFCATFVEWSTEIRSDVLMVPLWLAAVLLTVTPMPLRASVRLFAVGIFLGSAFWANQKVVYLALPLGVFLLLGGPERRWRPWQLGWSVLGATLPTAVCFLSAALGGNLGALLEHNFAGAAELAAADPYRRFRPLVLRHLLVRDAGLVALTALAAGATMGRWRGSTATARFLLVTALWSAATFFLTPGPFHYYLLGVLPTCAVLSAGWLAERAPQRWQSWPLALIALLYVTPPLLRVTQFRTPTNAFQLEVIRVGTALTDAATPVFDGAGVLFQRPDAYGFHWVLWAPELAAYRQGRLPPVVETIRAGGARLVLLTYRVLGLPDPDQRELSRRFPRLWGPICVPGFDSGPEPPGDPGSVAFELWYEGVYEVYPSGTRIDERAVDGVIQLTAGRHVARLPSGAQRFVVRDASYRARLQLPPEPTDWRVFGSYGYSY